MTLQVTVLGASGTYAGPGGACSGYLVQCDGFSLLVDAGPGTLANLQRHVSLRDLDAVIISHEHPDHWLELPVLRNAWKYALDRAGVPVYGTAGTLAFADPLCHGELAPTFDWRVITDGDELAIGPLTVRCSDTDHPPETLGLAIGDGATWLGYSADTGPGWSMSAFGVPIDLAIWEATCLDADKASVHGVHCSAAETGHEARAAEVRRLVLTHLWPGSDPEDFRAEAAATYGAPVDVAEPGAAYFP